MSISVTNARERVPVAVIAVQGALDASNYQDLIATARQTYAAGTQHVLLDLGRTTFISSSGIVALHSIALMLSGHAPPDPEQGWRAIHAAGRVRDAGRQPHLKLLNASPAVVETLAKVGLGDTFENYDDLAAALASF